MIIIEKGVQSSPLSSKASSVDASFFDLCTDQLQISTFALLSRQPPSNILYCTTFSYHCDFFPVIQLIELQIQAAFEARGVFCKFSPQREALGSDLGGNYQAAVSLTKHRVCAEVYKTP